MKKKILIFGATGTIGAYTAVELKNEYEVIAIGRRNSDNNFFKQMGIKYYSVDITNQKNFEFIKENNIDAVVHLAGVMPATMKGYNPELYIDSVIKGTLNVLNFCIKNNIQKIIFGQSRADSNYLMGKEPIPSDIVKKFPLTGDHAVYSISKNAAVDLIEHYHHEYGIKRFVLRLPTIYAYHPNPYFYVNGIRKNIAYRFIIDKAVAGAPIEIWGDPQKKKEIVYVKDAIQLIECCIKSNLDGGVYNMGRGVGVSLEEQVKGIIKVFCLGNNQSDIIYKPEMPDAREYINDIFKTKKDLGFNPQYDYLKLLQDYKFHYDNEPFQQLWGNKNDY